MYNFQFQENEKEALSQLKKVAGPQSISCKHCNLHFSTQVWLKRHIEKCHTKVGTSATDPDPKSKIQNYKNQLESIQKTLDKKNTKESNKKKAKTSPTKHTLREQLKTQLAAQQKLLQVQQEIFEKTSKAQQDIFELIAKLDDDSDEHEEIDETEENEEFVIETKAEEVHEVQQEDVYYPNAGEGEFIVAENVEEYAYLPENYEVEEQELVAEDDNYMVNEQNDTTVQDEQATMVIVRSGDDEEEYELIEVVEQMYDNLQLEQIENGIDFEVVGKDENSVHCRIIANDEQQEEIEYVDVQMEPKVPIKVDVGKIQEIAQKRFSKQLDDGQKTDETDDSKLLNSTINKSEKLTNEYIQKVVQNAVPSDDGKFECPICQEMVSNRYSLGPHILRLHSKQKSKICQYCDRSFTCTGDLTRYVHIAVSACLSF